MSEDLVRFDVRDHIATITLNRPERRNALNYPAYAALEAALKRASADNDVRCVIVTGADPAFCSGDDVREIMAGPKPVEAQVTVRHAPTPAAMAALDCEKPMIAAVNGAAIGWGMELALYAGIRIASDKATFSEMFIKRGLICDVGGFYRLPAVVGPAKAAELLFTGLTLSARESLDLGELFQTLEHWRRLALLQRDPENFAAMVRRVAETLSGEPVPDGEPFELTRAKAGM